MKDFQVILEEAAFAGKLVEVITKGRGSVMGYFTGVDEFDTDEDRLGYYIRTGKHREDTVFLDEIVDIKVIPKADGYKTLGEAI